MLNVTIRKSDDVFISHSKLLTKWKHIQTSTWYALQEIYSRDSYSSSTSSLLSLWTQVWLENLCLQLPQGYHLLHLSLLV